MTDQEIPSEHRGKFQLIFVGMFWRDDSDPVYKDWTEGRIEIRAYGEPYSNDEIRYCTKKTEEWFAFQDKYNLEWLTSDELEKFKNEVNDRFKKSTKI